MTDSLENQSQDNLENSLCIRFRALDYLGVRLHALVFVGLPDCIRVISFRKASQREVMLYESRT